jgi:hypothetical protein
MAYDLGDLVPLRINIKDTAGVAANASAVTITVTAPDGTATTTAITPTTTGTYDHTVTPASAGRYTYRWLATGTNASAHTGTFEVDDPADLPVISLDEAKAYLNVTSTSGDDEIRGFILAATDIAERETGRQLRRRTYTENLSGGYRALTLSGYPILSVTSVVEDGVTLTAGTDYVADLTMSIVYRGTITAQRDWQNGRNNITVTYVSGEATPNPTAQLLVKELTRHLWRTQRGASPMSMGGGDDAYVPGGNNVLTYRVRELVDMLKVAGIA